MTYKRGDIVLVYFPFSDFKTVKQRPALVVQADGLSTGLPNIILALITSNMTRAGLSCRVAVWNTDKEFGKTRLHSNSVILTDQLATIDQTLIAKKLGIISDMSPIDNALRVTFSL